MRNHATPLRVVVKLGTNVLTAGSERLNRPRMIDFVRQLAHLKQAGHEIILVADANENSADGKLNKALHQNGLIETFYRKFQIVGLTLHVRGRE